MFIYKYIGQQYFILNNISNNNIGIIINVSIGININVSIGININVSNSISMDIVITTYHLGFTQSVPKKTNLGYMN